MGSTVDSWVQFLALALNSYEFVKVTQPCKSQDPYLKMGYSQLSYRSIRIKEMNIFKHKVRCLYIKSKQMYRNHYQCRGRKVLHRSSDHLIGT